MSWINSFVSWGIRERIKALVKCIMIFKERGRLKRDNEIIPYLTYMGFWRSNCLVWGVVRVAASLGNKGDAT